MSKTIYIAGESRVVDAVQLPVDKDKTGYERFVPEGTVPDGYVPEGTVPDGYVPEGTLPDGAVIPEVIVTDTEAVAPKAFASGTYLQHGMTVFPAHQCNTTRHPVMIVFNISRGGGLTNNGSNIRVVHRFIIQRKAGFKRQKLRQRVQLFYE